MGSVPVTVLTVNETTLFGVTDTANDHTGTWLERWVLSERTARLFLPEQAITFTET